MLRCFMFFACVAGTLTACCPGCSTLPVLPRRAEGLNLGIALQEAITLPMLPYTAKV